MKKIILSLIISLFFVNFSFSDEKEAANLCKFKHTNKKYFYQNKNFENFLKNCNWNEFFWLILEENWNFFYYVWEENRNVRFYLNDKIVIEEKADEVFRWSLFLSKYWNHFSFSFKEYNDKDYESRKNFIYIDNIKKEYKNQYDVKISEIFENFDKTFYLSKIQTSKIDNILKKFLEKKENISKIDDIIKKAEKLKENYNKNLEKNEILNYLIFELKIYQLKNK